jgi:glycosyltransferase involved in cell wall biosynthesis
MLKVLAILPDDMMTLGAVGYHRLYPLQQLSLDKKIKLYSIPSWDVPHDILEKDLKENIDVVYISRSFNMPEDETTSLLKLIKNHCKLVVDVDDWWLLPNTHIIYRQWQKNKEPQKAAQVLKAADAVTCSTPYLADKVLPLNKNIAILRNSLNLNHQQWQTPKLPYDAPRFLWAGGTTHALDVDLLRRACTRLASADFDHFMIHAGYRNEEIYRGYAHVLSGGGKNAKRFARIDKASVFDYGQFYDHCDIALAPLTVNEFNRCKSELKAIEAGVKGCAFIGSANSPYEYVIDKNTGILVSNKNDWWHAIKRMATDHELRETTAIALSLAVKECYNFNHINNLRLEVIKSLL